MEQNTPKFRLRLNLFDGIVLVAALAVAALLLWANFKPAAPAAGDTAPAVVQMLDHDSREYVLATMEGFEDVLVTVEAPCTITDEAVTVGGGYALRVGLTAYIRGEGYMASGPIISMEREGQE